MKALIIDDNADIRLLLERVLAMLRIESIQAPGGRDGLDLLDAGWLPDLVLLDVQMPVMDGWDTLARIRSLDGAARDVPVILCTVKSAADDLVRGWQLGCDAYVSKPFDVRALMRTVREVCERTPEQRLEVRVHETAAARRAAVLARH